jgi:hypothetical protein
MNKTAAGPWGVYHAGREYDIEHALAAALTSSGAAEYVGSPHVIEEAVIEPEQKAVTRAKAAKAKKKRGK